jgi:hypothetical protein
MIGGILVIVLTAIIAFAVVNRLKARYPFIDDGFLKGLFFYHVALSIAYYLYVLFNPSDSKAYYYAAEFSPDWYSLYGTSTTFIKFLAYPFVNMGFSYEATMALFAFFGYLGFVYMYILFRESIRFKHTFLGMDLFKLIFYLPNLHFWSGSLGKGSVIFLGLGLYFFGINKPAQRWLAIAIGGVIIYHVRAHIMLVVLVSSLIGFVFSSRGVSPAVRFVFLLACSVAFFFIYRDVLTMVGINEDELITQGLDLSQRASELTKATSGVDITNYSLPMQVFTFLYRPLFFDAPGLLGLVVSVENVFYLVITFKLLNLRGLRFLLKGSFIVKSAFVSFITVSIALAQISGNLGLAMRQKSQVMMLLMFVIIIFLDAQRQRPARPAPARRKKYAFPQPVVDEKPPEPMGTIENQR